MRSISTAFALAGLSLLAAACTVNTAPPARTTVLTQPAPAVVTQPAPTVVMPGTTTYVTPPRTTVVTPAY
ncbi:hypothetical protein AB4Z01_00700 [Inquilinus sp. YAF38]|uniref:hypothetical protein n=1 Tax=Inquilinus sp. YAF38 TaxID=3233084 RepID=UPI003F8FADC5